MRVTKMHNLKSVLLLFLIMGYSIPVDAQMRTGEVTWSTNAGFAIPNSKNDSETLFGYGINVGVDKIISDANLLRSNIICVQRCAMLDSNFPLLICA